MKAVGPREMAIIHAIISEHVPDCTVLAFGSRQKGTHSETSDLDLAVALAGKQKLGMAAIGRIKEAFMESDIPYTVDVLDYNGVSDTFRAIIDKGHEVIWDTSKNCVP
jgi:predicted nucleotidyltransferase